MPHRQQHLVVRNLVKRVAGSPNCILTGQAHMLAICYVVGLDARDTAMGKIIVWLWPLLSS